MSAQAGSMPMRVCLFVPSLRRHIAQATLQHALMLTFFGSGGFLFFGLGEICYENL